VSCSPLESAGSFSCRANFGLVKFPFFTLLVLRLWTSFPAHLSRVWSLAKDLVERSPFLEVLLADGFFFLFRLVRLRSFLFSETQGPGFREFFPLPLRSWPFFSWFAFSTPFFEIEVFLSSFSDLSPLANFFVRHEPF